LTIPADTTLMPGDLLFFRGRQWISGAIRWATRSRGEDRTWANHVGGVGTGGTPDKSSSIEALWKVKEQPFLKAIEGADVQVWRKRDLPKGERYELAVHARSYLGRKYGPLKIVAHLCDAVLSKIFGGNPYVFRRLSKMDNYPVCYWVWSFAYFRSIGYRFGSDPYNTSPDDMHDWCKSRPWEWERVA